MKTSVGLILISILLAFGLSSCSSEERHIAQVEKEINELKKQLPMEVAPNVFWTEVSFKDKEVSYIYVVKDLTDELRERLSDSGEFKPSMISALKGELKTSSMLSKGYIYKYTYLDSEGNLIYKCRISKLDF